MDGISTVAHQGRNRVLLCIRILEPIVRIRRQHALPVVNTGREVSAEFLSATRILVGHLAIAVLGPFPVLHHLRHRRCHAAGKAPLPIYHGTQDIVRPALIPYGTDKSGHNGLACFATHIRTVYLSFVDRIHEDANLVEPVLQTDRQVVSIEAAAVGIAKNGASDGIIVGNEDNAAFGTVEDVIAQFVSFGAKYELTGFRTQT